MGSNISKFLESYGDKTIPDDLQHSEELGDTLEHHGVKGMKWGVRKDRRRGSRRSGTDQTSSKKKARSAKKTSRSTSSNRARDLSDDELRQVINRLRLENDYNSLTKPKPGVVNEFMKRSGKTVADSIVTQVAVPLIVKAINDQVKKKM